MSKYVARWIIFLLPIFIMGTIVHEPIQHELFEYTTQNYNPINNNLTVNISMETDTTLQYEIERNVLCVIRYTRSVQTYNTITLFIHLVAPFVANFFSALFIIFGTARRRSTAQTDKKNFKEHVFNQMSEHKQLLISPFILLVLGMPRFRAGQLSKKCELTQLNSLNIDLNSIQFNSYPKKISSKKTNSIHAF